MKKEKNPKYGMRKLSIGFVSCIIGFSVIISNLAIAQSGYIFPVSVADTSLPVNSLAEPVYNGKTIHITNENGSNNYNDLKTALQNASDGDTIEFNMPTVEDFGAGLTIDKKVKIIGNGYEVAIRAQADAKITINKDVIIENINLSSRKESQKTFPIVVNSTYFKMNDVSLTNGGVGDTFSLIANPKTQDSEVANISISGTKSTSFDSIEVGESGNLFSSDLQFVLDKNVASKNGLTIKNYTQDASNPAVPIIIDNSKISSFKSENANNDSVLVFRNSKINNIYLSNIKNVELTDGARVTLDSDEYLEHSISNTTFSLASGTTLNLSNISNDITIKALADNSEGTIEVASNSKMTVVEKFAPNTKILLTNPNNSSTFTLVLPSQLEDNKKPNIVIFEGNTEISANGSKYTARVGKSIDSSEDSDSGSENVVVPEKPEGGSENIVVPEKPEGGSNGSNKVENAVNSSSNNSSSQISSNNKDDKIKKVFKISKIAGKDRVETAIKIAKHLYPNGTDTVILVNKNSYADSLSALTLSNVKKAPILYTDLNNIDDRVIIALKELGAKNIILLGGTSSISDVQYKNLLSKNFSVNRVAGKDRFDTSIKVLEEIEKLKKVNTGNIVIANGESYPDALSISTYSSTNKVPVLLVSRDYISKDIIEAIKKYNKNKIFIAGGYDSVSPKLENELRSLVSQNIVRLAGADRYETSQIISKFAKANAKNAVIASGEKFEDALLAGTLVSDSNTTLLLGKKDSLINSLDKYLRESNIENITLIGGENTLSSIYTEKLSKNNR